MSFEDEVAEPGDHEVPPLAPGSFVVRLTRGERAALQVLLREVEDQIEVCRVTLVSLSADASTLRAVQKLLTATEARP